jgi:hypothetical protein
MSRTQRIEDELFRLLTDIREKDNDEKRLEVLAAPLARLLIDYEFTLQAFKLQGAVIARLVAIVEPLAQLSEQALTIGKPEPLESSLHALRDASLEYISWLQQELDYGKQ